ncbi:glycosyltransferase family 2 protein [Olivibacter domesticus]|uniref:Glycosyltransferase, catalytic subunit of cellulose synthase and poly-beta-1,6-N-acetylglucosamine synthase n=1 Tax=Olivibacter domesticus TaxID=407022 RepID=A0A1H7KXD5_OLID1|nr:glycosyltransferase [Olivibacter domesticus]SEK91200.1 Glycosyltransferase, catalytic subunit of cellulose synthase and poly-beta-1,6-N-acetylglucosamine synthase [Olivibacter domesticus]
MEKVSIREVFAQFFEGAVFAYGLTLLLIYALLAFFSLIAVKRYKRLDDLQSLNDLVASSLTPGITVLAPAYNEGLTIIMNVRSLLTLNYPNYEVIIINDGSEDTTLLQMEEEFDLLLIDYAYNERIITQPVKGVYKSKNPAYSKLTVIDKVNGKSKADAVNAGINAANYAHFVCTDVDCVLHKDTLLELIKPVLQEEKKRVIAVGATLRLGNSCDFDHGVMIRMRPPRQLLARFQEVEYIRAFVMGKMGWSVLNSVPNVSGGLGLFDKEVAVSAGGYDHQSFGEDMELMIRMCRFSLDNGIDYVIHYLPKTLCWTEGPATIKVFMRQRTRWARGLAQLMYTHFSMVLRPKYKTMGMVVMPYNFLFELCAPLIEFIGILIYLFMALTGVVNWPYAVILLIFVYTYAVMITTFAILTDQLAFRYYKTWKEVLLLCTTPLMEFFIYHPLTVIFSIKGYLQFLGGKKQSWGNMQRQGMGTKKI